MGLLRHTSQHARRVRLLVAGAAPFADLGEIWSDHFINLREIKIGYFGQATATGLLMAPIPEFPSGAIGPEIAAHIYQRSKGQPFLTQVYGHFLVETLNHEKRKHATLADVTALEPQILLSWNSYFKNIWNEALPEGQAALHALAHGAPAHETKASKATQQRLRRRQFIDDNGQLAIPLFGRWIRERDDLN